MKILEISHLYPVPHDPLLGIAMHNQIKYVNLKSKKFQVLVVSPIAWTPFPISKINAKWEKISKVPRYDLIDNIKVYHSRYLTFPKAFLHHLSGERMYYGIRKTIEKIEIKFKFDLIHAHMAMPDGYAAMLLSNDYKKPFIVTYQATDLDITANRNDRCFKKLQNVFLNANKIISPSPRLSSQLNKKFKILPETIGYGFNQKEVYSKKSSLSNKFKKYRILLSVSRLIVTKGIELNLYALKRLINKYDNLLYIIIGEGPIRSDLENLVDNLGLKNYVKFLGQLSYGKVMEYMSICEIFTLPSWQETFGLVYIEAMAHGKPVIGCKGQGVDGIIEHRKTGLLANPKDVASLGNELDFLLSHPIEANEIGKQARDLIMKNYTWEKSAEKLTKIYTKVLDR